MRINSSETKPVVKILPLRQLFSFRFCGHNRICKYINTESNNYTKAYKAR